MARLTLDLEIDFKKAVETLEALAIALEPRRVLTAIANRQVRWIADNFRQEGAEKKWVPLKPNTVVKRIGQSSAVLQDKGQLRQSFVQGQPKSIDDTEVVIGSSVRYALFHQDGTKPYTISPRSQKFLAFPVAVKVEPANKGKDKGQKFQDNWVYRKKVRHPGLPARPMLPSAELAAQLSVEQLESIIQFEMGRVRNG